MLRQNPVFRPLHGTNLPQPEIRVPGPDVAQNSEDHVSTCFYMLLMKVLVRRSASNSPKGLASRTEVVACSQATRNKRTQVPAKS
jgi:hypothetical protein